MRVAIARLPLKSGRDVGNTRPKKVAMTDRNGGKNDTGRGKLPQNARGGAKSLSVVLPWLWVRGNPGLEIAAPLGLKPEVPCQEDK